jgi:hypothetical protein
MGGMPMPLLNATTCGLLRNAHPAPDASVLRGCGRLVRPISRKFTFNGQQKLASSGSSRSHVLDEAPGVLAADVDLKHDLGR